MKKICFSFIALVCVSFTAAYSYAEKSLNIEYILDASNSMNEPLPSAEKKIDVAKKVMCNLIDNIATEATGKVNLGLRIYGANFQPTQTKEQACMDSVLALPMTGVNASALKEKINSVVAAGFTPIAYSLELASKDFTVNQDNTNIMVLVSDGKETCGGDPAAVIKKLKEQGFNVPVYVIGFAVDADTKAQLESIASVSGGSYFTADNADQLTKSLAEIKQRAFEEYESTGKEVTPSDNIGGAPEIAEGEYKGALAMHETKFYKVKVYKGQIIKSAFIVKKTPYEASNGVINQTFTVKLFDNSGKDVASQAMTIEGNPAEVSSFKAEWTADKDGWVYISVSASKNHDTIGKPNSLYPKDSVPAASSYTLKVNIKGEKAEASDESMFQKYTYRDLPGGSGFEKAAEIKLNEFITESIYMKETRFYKLPIKKGTVKINVSAVTRKPWYQAMNSVINMTYTLKICDEDWAEIASQSLTVGDNPSEPFSISAVVEVGTNEELYISLSSSENHGNLGQKDLVDIYPEGFRPDATKFTILAVEE